ncbi:30S ribosomal protein S6e [Candidatus Micrarchaeota archaeon]|nr:30S ribosomal protein S6e [Candidatus Micrarchaeota archaeon]
MMKLVFNDPNTGHSFQKEIEKDKTGQLLGKKIGEEFSGSVAGLDGYTLKITGGSLSDGTPMRFDIPGSNATNALLPSGPGINEKKYLEKGMRVKKRVAGSTVSQNTAQVNAVISAPGAKPLTDFGFLSKKQAETKTKEEKPADASKPAPEKKSSKSAEPNA